MKTAIVYQSIHHGNTKKLVDAIAQGHLLPGHCRNGLGVGPPAVGAQEEHPLALG